MLVVRGKRLLEIEIGPDKPSDEELAQLVIGRSGNLRAPAFEVGDAFVVGYHPDTLERCGLVG